jgi:hypothetical protein
MPVLAPVVPIVGGALLIAGAVKWLMNPDERKSDEIEHQREMFEKAFRGQLEAARRELTAQLDATSQQFHSAAERFVRPVILEAQAADRLASLHLKIAHKLNDHTQKALSVMLASFAT